MSKRFNKYYNTLKHLKILQLFYRLFYLIRNKLFTSNKLEAKGFSVSFNNLNLDDSIYSYNSFKKNVFDFLNISESFNGEIDWDYGKYGKLWTYNLNYFEYLNQKDIQINEGLKIIKQFIYAINSNKSGLEPYPTSLRGREWIKFLSYNKINDKRISTSLYSQYQLLVKNIEYHILGNHLFENGFSILMAAYFFKDKKFYSLAVKILNKELNEQILNDGGHFERSPMYHQLMLFRVLDSINLVKNNKDLFFDQEFYNKLMQKAKLMLGWLEIITMNNGEIPYFNDSTSNIAPSTKELSEYANRMGVFVEDKALGESGFRKTTKLNYELIVNLGEIKSNYQPGHSHSEFFSFCLNVDGKPVIVDTGISTYEKNEVRQKERNSESHNTVVVNETNQMNVWSGFRLAERGNVNVITDKANELYFSHDSYVSKFGVVHSRKFNMDDNSILITDSLDKHCNSIAYLHFHPDRLIEVKYNDVYIDSKTCISFDNIVELKIDKYNYAVGFNKTQEATKIRIFFNEKLITKLNIKN